VTSAGADEADERALVGEAQTWRDWLFDAALPLWAEHGLNPSGGFHDTLDDDLRPAAGKLRMRVQGRQTYVFAQAGKLGWPGPWRPRVEHGLSFLLNVATQPHGFVAHAFDLDGTVLDGPPDLYDQAFALLAYASAYEALGTDAARTAAHALMSRLATRRDGHGGYRELPGSPPTLRANPQMHLLEAVLAWRSLDAHPVWAEVAADLAALCRTQLVQPGSGALVEFFDGDWRPAPGETGQTTEPGHHFEWAWLLLQQSPENAPLAHALCARAERLGVDAGRGVALNAIDLDGRPLDGEARLWPQCERLRATLALRDTDPAWTDAALNASRTLRRYTAAAPAGLWRDVIELDGGVRPQPAPASSLYHIVSALSELLSLASSSDVRSAGAPGRSF
jgi:mannose-6-phosphate isomerase